MDDIIRHGDRYYILATASLADEQIRVLKEGDTFAVFDRHGDIRPLGFENHGLFHDGTRFLSRLRLTIEGRSPLLLSSEVREGDDLFVVNLTNPGLPARAGRPAVPQGTVHICRSLLLWRGALHERIRLQNYGSGPCSFRIQVETEADFVDIFEVRGFRRKARGSREPSEADPAAGRLVHGYRGLDGVRRRTEILFSARGSLRFEGTTAAWSVRLAPGEVRHCDYAVSCSGPGGPACDGPAYDTALGALRRRFQRRSGDVASIRTSNENFDEWLYRSRADLFMMLTETEHGPYPYAGIPWYAAVFGRDGLITARETLWLYPEIARGVLSCLAALQARDRDDEAEAEPGKILHERRGGELAALGEIPFGRYYGTVDATPLFVGLAGRYLERSGDRAFAEEIWPAVERAIEWMRRFGDRDGDGFLEYGRRRADGLRNQGWKDSDDAVFHADGRPAEPPIALVEVQAYAYDAFRQGARLARALGRNGLADELEKEARGLRERFEAAFWWEQGGTYALALDGGKRPCLVRASNAGHALAFGIAPAERADRVAALLVGEDFFSGWGIRTLARGEARYNPMSYHNGSIWPHDNALIAAGLARYGHKDKCLLVLGALFDAARHMELRRLPELYCGFRRRPGEQPTHYPVACDPQSWAAGAVFLLIEAALGLAVDARRNRISFHQPVLPESIERLFIENLAVGASRLDIVLERYERDVGINVRRNTGGTEILVRK